jgi:hypothetical protein
LVSYFVAKRELLTAVAQVASSTDPQAVAVALQPLAARLVTSREGVEKQVKSPTDDAVFTFAKALAQDAFKPANMTAVRQLAQDVPLQLRELDATWARLVVIPRARAGQIAQETMNLLWRQIYPRLGGVAPDERPPSLKQLHVALVPDAEPPLLRARGTFATGLMSRGGQLEIAMTEQGLPDVRTLKVDLPSELTARIAEGAARQYVRWALGPEARILGFAARGVTDQGDEHVHHFTFLVTDRNRGHARLRIDVTGEGFPLYATLGRGGA